MVSTGEYNGMDNGHIWDLLVNFLGVFLGFLLTWLLQKITEKKSEIRRNESIKKLLSEELIDLRKIFENYKDHEILNVSIQTPSWDSLQSSGMLIAMVGNKDFDEKLYQGLIDFYTDIKSNNDKLLFKFTDKNKVYIGELKHLIDKLLCKLTYK